MAKSKFIPTMRKIAEMSVKDVTVQYPRPLKGIRNPKNIAGVVGADGVLALWRLFLAHNLPHDHVFLLTCTTGEKQEDGSPYPIEIRVIPFTAEELRPVFSVDELFPAPSAPELVSVKRLAACAWHARWRNRLTPLSERHSGAHAVGGKHVNEEVITLEEAAQYLQCAPGTLMNWISAKKFTHADGLRRVGGLSRVYFPTLKARFAAGTLMMNGNGQKKSGIPKAKPHAAKPGRPRRNARVELYEALREVDSAVPELPDELCRA